MLGSILKKKIHNEKGFTLAELLVVIAILAILVAISIPIFTSRLDAAKESTDKSNIRAAKALVSSEIMEGITSGTYYYDADKGILQPDNKTNITGYGQTSSNKDKVIKIEITDSKMKISWE